MAAAIGDDRGSAGLIDALAQPRPATRVALWVLMAAVAQAAWVFLDRQLLAYLSGLAGPLALVCATTIWSMRDKADSSLDGEFVDAAAFKRQRLAARLLRRKFAARAAWVLFAALLAVGPAVASNVANNIWHWMVLLAGAGLAEAFYGYLLAASWDEELRAHRDRLALERKRHDERQQLLARMEASEGLTVGASPAPASASFLPH